MYVIFINFKLKSGGKYIFLEKKVTSHVLPDKYIEQFHTKHILREMAQLI